LKIKLDLSSHCIETEIKKIYNRFVSEYLKKKSEDTALEQRIETLKTALETLDFGFLRKEFPALAGRHNDEVMLSSDDTGTIRILINGKKIKDSEW